MKIAFVVPGFSADENDWCIPAHRDIVKWLARTNKVHVFTMRYPHRVDTYTIGNARVHSFNGVGSRGLHSARLWQNVLRAIQREHARARFNVIHAIFGSEAGSIAVSAGKWLRVPSVVWLVNGELIGLREIQYGADLAARQRWMNHFILRSADCVLCGCDNMLAAVRARKRTTGVEKIPLGVNLARFTRAITIKARSRAEFINVGSLLPVKDQATLLRAFQIVAAQLPHAHLTLAGSGTLENELHTLTRALDISNRVTFAGNVPHDALATLYQNADVFVQASQHEGQGMALLEAAACGCAVCGTDVGALADFAKQDAGRSSRVGDANALANTMLDAYAERAVLSARARELVTREYDLEIVGARVQTLYAQLKQGTDISFEHTIARA